MVASLVGAAGAFQLAYPVLAVASGAWLLLWARPEDYLEALVWVWVTAALARRVLDHAAGYTNPSLVVLAPYLMTCVGVLAAAAHHRSVRGPVAVFLAGYACLLGVGVAVGLASGPPGPVAADALRWLAPLCAGAFAVAAPFEAQSLARCTRRVVVWLLPLVGLYGVWQWTTAPAWDASWLRESEELVSSFGTDEPFGMRVWSTLNSPATAAFCLSWLLLLALAQRLTAWTAVALAAGAAALSLTNVRAAWVALALAVLPLLLLSRSARRQAALVVPVAVAVLVAAQPLRQNLLDRLGTLSTGLQDESVAARIGLQLEQAPSALRDLLGSGIGSTGTGARLGPGGSQAVLANADSGYLELLVTFGGPLGYALAVATVAVSVAAVLRLFVARPRVEALVPWACLVGTLPVSMLLGNSLTGMPGVLLLAGLGLLANNHLERRGAG
ncbi:O-antigen ligase family protein [Vallicoccus soli]|uniref:O-antigen ligase-related domain-containing protein n=1 Tax=Vallicoccus soli TaxID=2339232 RepID=A0A3A3Z1P7_9ACTN|nr:O-antigen ligase family protein [Vallicoccus soli]RJK98179.1 hypothetical protein D5H78_04535 [Vallicoccus soli]